MAPRVDRDDSRLRLVIVRTSHGEERLVVVDVEDRRLSVDQHELVVRVHELDEFEGVPVDVDAAEVVGDRLADRRDIVAPEVMPRFHFHAHPVDRSADKWTAPRRDGRGR